MNGRQQQVILTLRTPSGGTTTKTVNAVWRIDSDANPVWQGPTDALFHLGTQGDVVALFNESDITLQQLRACIYAQLGADAAGAQVAQKYTLLGIVPAGMMPGGDRFYTRWTRQR